MHLFDAMHIGKNVTETLCKILDGRHDREKIAKICTDIQESNHALKDFIESNSNGDCINMSALPWLLIEKKIDALKEVIKKYSRAYKYINCFQLISGWVEKKVGIDFEMV